jgi:hypothetical protein
VLSEERHVWRWWRTKEETGVRQKTGQFLYSMTGDRHLQQEGSNGGIVLLVQNDEREKLGQVNYQQKRKRGSK